MNKGILLLIFMAGFIIMQAAMAFSASTPADTPTATVTPTVIVSSRVKINHNRFNPMLAEEVEIQDLNARHGNVSIRVFNSSGTLVRKILEEQEPGTAVPAWDGRNSQGEAVASGVYFIIVTGHKLHKRFRVAVIK